jgi:DNA-binding winged helix-turn-helix (wHTH) protein
MEGGALPMDAATPQPKIDWIAFGPFILFPGQRLLKHDGKAVRIGDKAFDLLVTLIRRPGEFYSNIELADEVWHRE